MNFGFLFNFFSSFGQTFFISLFVPYWIESLQISNASFGTMYAMVTIAAAFLLTVSGKFIDQMPLKKFGLLVFGGLILSVIVLAVANNLAMLVIGIGLVRWFGQGLMTHTSSTGIARHFQFNRGRALSVTGLGHPAGQFMLPLLVIPLIDAAGWRLGLFYMAVLATLVMIPSVMAVHPVAGFKPGKAFRSDDGNSQPGYFKSLDFWIIAANSFVVPFLCTAVFLYQFVLGQNKGWDASWVAFSFSFFAVSNATALLFSGELIDRFSGVKLFPLYLIPALLSLVIITLTGSKWIFPLFYMLLGASAGLGSAIKTALQVEVYGSGNLGRIRSYLSSLLVVSTALGPPFFGYFIDRHFSFDAIMGFSAVLVFIIMIASFRLWRRRPEPASSSL